MTHRENSGNVAQVKVHATNGAVIRDYSLLNYRKCYLGTFGGEKTVPKSIFCSFLGSQKWINVLDVTPGEREDASSVATCCCQRLSGSFVLKVSTKHKSEAATTTVYF